MQVLYNCSWFTFTQFILDLCTFIAHSALPITRIERHFLANIWWEEAQKILRAGGKVRGRDGKISYFPLFFLPLPLLTKYIQGGLSTGTPLKVLSASANKQNLTLGTFFDGIINYVI